MLKLTLNRPDFASFEHSSYIYSSKMEDSFPCGSH